jgi:hypothetical protein
MRYAIRVIAVGIADYIGMGPGPCLAFGVCGRIDLIIFEIGCNPDSAAFTAGPDNPFAIPIG